MTDVIQIAKSRRSRLVAEIARLEDFISMAETLLRLEEDPARSRGWLTDVKESERPSADPAAEAEGDRGDLKTAGEGADATGAATAADPGSLDPGLLDAGAVDPASLESADGGHRNLFAPQGSGSEEELVLGPEGSATPADDEPGLDAAIGQKLRQRRWMMGMTKRQLAEKLGIGVEEIQNFELGLAHIGNTRIWELASALDVPTSYFFEDAPASSGETDAKQAPVASPARDIALARTA